MKNKLIIGLTGITLLSMLIVGCSKAPKTEIEAATAAIERARVAGADVYLQDEFADLKDSMNVVMLKIEEQNSNTSKDYTGLKEKLVELATTALELETKSITRKEEISNQIQTTMSEVQKLVEENGKLLLEVSEKNKNEAEFTIISGEQKEVDSLVSESNALLQEGNVIATLDKVKTAKEKASFINKNLQELTSKDNTKTKTKKTS